MRKGQNPAKAGQKAYSPRKLAVVTLLYIPFQEGYYHNSLDIFKFHLMSLHQYTSEEFDYYVVDNGSCGEVKESLQKLQKDGVIDWLILSPHNLGKTGALNLILPGIPNEWICYTDSDMLFRPGWLEACRKIDENFPDCGMIGAQPVFPDWEVDKGNSNFRKSTDPQYQFNQEHAPDWVIDQYCLARGINQERELFYRNLLLDKVVDKKSKTEAYLGGNSHQQYLVKKEVIAKILPLPSGLQLSREEDTYQDRRLDELGYTHLTTTIPLIYHMGNTIDAEIQPEIDKLSRDTMGVKTTLIEKQNRKNNLLWRWLNRLAQNKKTRQILMRVYSNLYEVFSE